MGRPKVLYLSDKAFDILKDIENASQYVTKLIEESTLSIKKDLIKEKLEAETKIEIFSKKVENIDKKIQETNLDRKLRIDKEESLKEKNIRKQEEQRTNIKIALKDGIGRDPTSEEVDEYLVLFKEGETNIWNFIDKLRNRDFQPIADEEITEEELSSNDVTVQ